MFRPVRHTKSLKMGWGCAACHGREAMQVEEATELNSVHMNGAVLSQVIPHPELLVCAKCGILYMTEIVEEKNT